METKSAIYFYGTSGRYGYLSNFYRTTFVVDGITFNCSEQYFMYIKCITFDKDNTALLEDILNETSPTKIKAYGRKVQHYNEKKWSEIRYGVMLRALYYKFDQNPLLKQKLIDTGEKTLYESSPYDRVWGIGMNAEKAISVDYINGFNLLGKALMETRSLFKTDSVL